MHVMYVHQNYPAQFGHIARHLVQLGRRCTFVSRTPGGFDDGIEKIQYKPAGTPTPAGHYCARTFERTVWHCDSVYRALKKRPDIKPDLIVGHSGFGTTLFLPELYPGVPIVNYFEYYYRPHDNSRDWDFRSDLPWTMPEAAYLRARCRNAMILLDLQNCDVAYAPTEFQRSVFPPEYHAKLRTIFDGVDRKVYNGHGERYRPPGGRRRTVRIAKYSIPPTTRIVTYVSRGFEAMRGFDIFMRAARRIAREYPDVVFVIVGQDKVEYGFDRVCLRGRQTFRQWVLQRLAEEEGGGLDMSKFLFVGRLSPMSLGRVLAATDLHIYLTAPFILSWSMMDAMSCGAVVLGSATAPVTEMIRDGRDGLLADFFDPDAIAQKALPVLRDPAAHRPLGRAAEQKVAEMYSMEAVLPQMMRMYDAAANRAIPSPAVAVPTVTAPPATVPAPPPPPIPDLVDDLVEPDPAGVPNIGPLARLANDAAIDGGLRLN